MSDQVTTETTTAEKSYFQTRAAEIGLTEELNKFLVKEHAAMPNSPVIEWHLLEEDPKTGDLLIPLFDINGQAVNYYKDNPGKLQNGKEKRFFIRRYKPGNERKTKDDKLIKYETPKGAKALPWISPNIIEAYKNKQQVNTLVITEGYLKAMAGYINGLHIFGISGIQNVKDKDTATLHQDIIEAIKTLQVKNIVLLYDGDCNQISLNALNDGRDLRERPYGFFSAAQNTVELLKDYRDKYEFDIYFAHVNSNNLDGKPKGLDDLFNADQENKNNIVKELTTFSKIANYYFIKYNITYNLTKVYRALHIGSPEEFYTAHSEIIKEKEFTFRGTKYKYDIEKSELKVIVPGAAKFYVRVGDEFYKEILVPNKIGILEKRLVRRSIATIKQDHGKEILDHIKKLEAFCNKPSHLEHQKIIDNCYNRYHPFDWEIDQSLGKDCPIIMEFLQHIFGEQLEIGLDYVQLLLLKPEEPLPILCLVSKENQTGKSTFAKLLKAIFTSNMVTIGNDDLENGFNGSWADKLVIHCEELFVDKKKTIEKIKALSTGDKIMINQKGVDQVEIDFFGKFIFNSNNEENFINITEYDDRYWIRRVGKAKNNNPNLLAQMEGEIQQFLNFLIDRKLSTKKETRMWFKQDLLVTDALKKVVKHNKPQAETEITSYVKNFMLEYGFTELKYTLKYITEVILKKRYGSTYVEKILRENLKVKTTGTTQRFTVYEIGKEMENNCMVEKVVTLFTIGKPFVFEAAQILTPEEIAAIELCELAQFNGQTKPKIL